MFNYVKNLEPFGELKALCSHQGHEKQEGESKTVILFHGYGANAYDLFSLHRILSSSKVGNWYFPEGGLSIPGMPMGRAWFPLDVAALEKAMMEGSYREYSGPVPKKLVSVRESFLRSLQEMKISPQDCIIGGFSQGAMLATDIALNSIEDFAGLVILSGAFLGKEQWPELAEKKKINFFQSHGERDPVLSHQDAEFFYKTLIECGCRGEFESFVGEHEIPEKVIHKLKHFIETTF